MRKNNIEKERHGVIERENKRESERERERTI